MRWRLEWSAADALPARGEVLALQGMPGEAEPPARIADLHERARERYLELAEPRAVVAAIDATTFARVYRGEGRNAHRTPLEEVYPRAAALALFVATVGGRVGAAIGECFARHDPALGAMLDAVASAAADGLAHETGRAWLERSPAPADGSRVLPYSPGYCGWHVTGQRALFAVLGPAEIGVTLNASCLMQPLKSVSGVLVAGPAAAHRFRPAFEFCATCGTRQCRGRLASVARA